jgi:hypothetical protein
VKRGVEREDIRKTNCDIRSYHCAGVNSGIIAAVESDWLYSTVAAVEEIKIYTPGRFGFREMAFDADESRFISQWDAIDI